jgi:hypothetical protein
MMIYTSRYQNPALRDGNYTVVGVTRGAPKFPLPYTLSGNIMEIAPPGWLFNEYDREVFTRKYRQNIEKIGVKRIFNILHRYEALGKDVVLCCYEDVRKPGEWCHRQVFAEWWLDKTGEIIEELPDPSDIGGGKKKTRSEMETAEKTSDVPKEPEPRQLNLFESFA